MRARLKIMRGVAARDFGCGQGGEVLPHGRQASPKRGLRKNFAIRFPSAPNIAALAVLLLAARVSAFEGRITAAATQGGQSSSLLYTAGANHLRIEKTGADWPYARDIISLESDALTLLFPHNRGFVRLKPSAENDAVTTPGTPAPPSGLPPGMGMPMPPMEKLELKSTGETTNLLGFACSRYELKQTGKILEIWATDKLLPFRAWQQSQPPRFSPRMIEERWPDLLKARKLFPLLVTLKFENGREHYRFEVKSVTAEKITDDDGALFQPPPDYHEIKPPPF